MAKKVKFLDHKEGVRRVGRAGLGVGEGVLKELSAVVSHGVREATGAKKRKGPYRSNVAKGWFE